MPSETLGSATMSIRGKAFVAGIYEHPRRDIPDRTLTQIHAELALGAVADAGISLHDIDAVFTDSTVPGMGSLSFVEYLGLKTSYLDNTETGGSSYVGHVGHAAAAIAAGKCSIALCTLAGKPRNPNRGGGGGGRGGGGGGPNPDAQPEASFE